ncbi:MAG TPA: fused MFS/spermidine synthase [Thermodesulfovibrionales bacterium]|nr:fused MFS/spermidine synthase [Thermodesulfovibrionales bacterium]
MENDRGLRDRIAEKFIFVGFGLSGAAALIYEVVWTRSLSTIFGSSTYALATMLAAFMAGLSVGGGVGAILSHRIKRLNIAFALCELGIGLLGILTIPIIKTLTPLYIKTFYAFHLSFNTFSLVQFVVIFLVMGIPTTLMGLTFPIVVKLFSRGGRDVGTQSGYLYSINTFGAIIGSLSAGFLLIPLLGVKGSAIVAASLNIFVATVILILSKDFKKLSIAAAAVLAVAPVSVMIDKPLLPIFSYYNAFRFGSYEMVKAMFDSLLTSKGYRVLYHREGINGDVTLMEYRLPGLADGLALVNNGKQEAGDEKGFALLAYLPYFAYSVDKPRTALNIGLGSGHTLHYLSGFPLEHIDSVELSKGILEANRLFLRPNLFSDPRIEHIQADGRNYLLLTRKSYDIIIVSPSWAVELSSAGLLTDEFFASAKDRLTSNGMCAVWVDFFMMSHDDLEIVMRTFARHFSHSAAWYVEGDFIVLTGSNSPVIRPEQEIIQAINVLSPGLQDKYNLAVSGQAFERLPLGRINTDDDPIIEFRNARNIITWRSDES